MCFVCCCLVVRRLDWNFDNESHSHIWNNDVLKVITCGILPPSGSFWHLLLSHDPLLPSGPDTAQCYLRIRQCRHKQAVPDEPANNP